METDCVIFVVSHQCYCIAAIHHRLYDGQCPANLRAPVNVITDKDNFAPGVPERLPIGLVVEFDKK